MAGSLGLVRDVRLTASAVDIVVTCIAIGTAFEHPNPPKVPDIAWQRMAEEEAELEKEELADQASAEDAGQF